jgi:hypothetical protein
MADCCSSRPEPAQSPEIACPSCHERGASVDLRTVKAILTESALGRVRSASHRFCRTAACGIVYYDEMGATYDRAEVRVRVWQKEAEGDRPLCYCFGETEATIQQEFDRLGRSDAVARVRSHIEADRCACDIRNPRGACCLGDLISAVQRIASNLAADRSIR